MRLVGLGMRAGYEASWPGYEASWPEYEASWP